MEQCNNHLVRTDVAERFDIEVESEHLGQFEVRFAGDGTVEQPTDLLIRPHAECSLLLLLTVCRRVRVCILRTEEPSILQAKLIILIPDLTLSSLNCKEQ